MIRVYDHGSTYGISIGAQELWAFCLGRPGSGLEQIKGLRLSGWTGKAGRGTLLALEEGVDSGSWGSPLCGDFGVHPTSSPFSTPTLVPSQFPVGDSRNPTDAPPYARPGQTARITPSPLLYAGRYTRIVPLRGFQTPPA